MPVLGLAADRVRDVVLHGVTRHLRAGRRASQRGQGQGRYRDEKSQGFHGSSLHWEWCSRHLSLHRTGAVVWSRVGATDFGGVKRGGKILDSRPLVTILGVWLRGAFPGASFSYFLTHPEMTAAFSRTPDEYLEWMS